MGFGATQAWAEPQLCHRSEQSTFTSLSLNFLTCAMGL